MEVRTFRSAPKSIPSTICCSRNSSAQCGDKVERLSKHHYATEMANATSSSNGEGDLARVQVTVYVAQQQLFDFDSRSDLVDIVLPNVLQKVEEITTFANGVPRSTTKSAYMEERVYHLELRPDLSLRVSAPFAKQGSSSNALSPEKTGTSYAKLKCLQPSPVRKLVLGSTAESDEEEDEEDQQEAESDNRTTGWRVTFTDKPSEMSVVCVVETPTKKMALNVEFNVLDRLHPASPTTGLRMPPNNVPIAQMSQAKGGFALLRVGDGLLSVGGYTRDGVLGSTEVLDVHFNCWDDRSDLNTKRARFAAVECRGSPYIIGGSDGKNELGSVEIYDTKSLVWEKTRSRMVTPRSCFDAATVDGKIYAIGGVYYSTPLKSAEVYDPALHKWRLISGGMHTSRYGLSVAACCGKVYAIGGQTLGWNCLSSVECFDPKTSTWCKVASMKTPRRNAVSVSVNDKIYVIGGYNGSSAVNLVEVYDPRENVWCCLAPMHTKRSSASAVHMNGSIFVAGGYSGTSFLNSVERYDIRANQWSTHV